MCVYAHVCVCVRVYVCACITLLGLETDSTQTLLQSAVSAQKIKTPIQQPYWTDLVFYMDHSQCQRSKSVTGSRSLIIAERKTPSTGYEDQAHFCRRRII